MQKKEFDILLVRAKKLAERLEHAWLENVVPLQAEYATTPDRIHFSDRLSLTYAAAETGDLWNAGVAWISGWFRLAGTVPAAQRGKPIFIRLNFGCEILLFDERGKVRAGLTNQSAFAQWYNKEYHEITDLVQPDGTFSLWAEAAANHLGGIGPRDGVVTAGQSENRNYYHADIAKMEFGAGNSEMRGFFRDIKFLVELAEIQKDNPDPRSRQIVRALSDAINAYLDCPANAAAARAILKPIFARPATASSLKTTATGHAHIDTGWLWPVAESVRKTARTFASQLELIRAYPGYVFGASAPQHFQFLKDSYPELYEEVKQAVKDGSIEVQGGMWVEADCNVTGGEAMIRQFVHGKNFFMDEFEIDVRNLWIPDVFGYSAAMPQIIRKSNCDYFLTQKISWNQFNRFPHHTFLWRGIDGSEVLTHFPPEDTYNSECNPKGFTHAEKSFTENDFIDEFITLFGVGDGGGGPKADLIENALRAADIDGLPRVKMGRACDFFNRIERFRDQLDRWSGELYLELHRGTLTTQARTKRGNRKGEQILRQTEGVCCSLPGAEYPAKELDALWKKLLINQFHDILPGSSIGLVYERTEREHAEIIKECGTLLRRGAEKQLTPAPASLTLLNVLSVPYRMSVELPVDWAGREIRRADGGILRVQQENGRAVVATEIPAWGSVELRRGAPLAAPAAPSPSLVLENALVYYEFDADGRIVKAFDREAEREILSGAGNVLSLYVDRPNMWDAWDVDFFYEDEKAGEARASSWRRIAEGAVRQGLEFKMTVGENSRLTLRAYLDANSKRLEFRVAADWRERHRMLRVGFPTSIRAQEGSFDIQYGYTRRPTFRNTSWDMARFEMPAHRYADLSADGYGVALLNDCKYAYKVLDGVLDLNLLRSPTAPDPEADQGRHEFVYALFPHTGNLIDSNVMAEAAQLNLPPYQAESLGGNWTPPFALAGAGVSLDVAKKAEKTDDLVLRLVELRGLTSKATLTLPRAAAVEETDMLEWNVLRKEGTDSAFELELKPFEIRTLRIRKS